MKIVSIKNSSLNKYLIAAFVIFSGLLIRVNPVAAQSHPIKNIVIVHGAFGDGSGWRAVYNILTKKGYHVTIVQNPLTSLNDDVEATNRILAQQDGPVVLVGHSWAGVVITQAGVDTKVAALVYVAAFEPDKGETANQWSVTQPKAPSMRVTADPKGVVFFDRTTFHEGYCADLPKALADFMNASQQPIVGACFGTPVTEAAWKDKPSFGIVATEDHAINPTIERNMYKRAHTKITEIKGSHAVFISQPEAVAQVIINAAQKK
ncbi:alpha/beta hydrolase [Mucilaginibacter dorajii]|uniref:Alpha/beta hydrolase n=1 Tax=Mucilaginibacter dorajii TaxID=692994 RepID=A0ABP7PN09_9SPHI|nr:alpha/beta hydrolase [Mucilaginibacter dorajii]MCS3736295.1 pimeloyl-ACP methyl ester carboxylesterase [Mucilaginibacter dorajii]